MSLESCRFLKIDVHFLETKQVELKQLLRPYGFESISVIGPPVTEPSNFAYSLSGRRISLKVFIHLFMRVGMCEHVSWCTQIQRKTCWTHLCCVSSGVQLRPVGCRAVTL